MIDEIVAMRLRRDNQAQRDIQIQFARDSVVILQQVAHDKSAAEMFASALDRIGEIPNEFLARRRLSDLTAALLARLATHGFLVIWADGYLIAGTGNKREFSRV